MAYCQCEYCENLFNSLSGQKICPRCSKEIDEVFVRVRKYMYSTDEQVTVAKLVAELDVPEKAVNYLIREKRLTFGPRLMTSGKCRVCGAPTSGQALCDKCRATFTESMKSFAAEETPRRQNAPSGSFRYVYPLIKREDQD